MELTPGKMVAGKFLIVSRLGEGDRRGVVLARQVRSNRLVVLEALPAGSSERRAAMRFARAKLIRSAHVPEFVDIGVLPDGRPYVVIEYFEGTNLRQLYADAPVAIGDAVDHLLQACDAVAAAHDVDLVHRNLQLSSLFRTTREVMPCLKVLDFTAVQARAEEGKPADINASMAPELGTGATDVDRRCDVWALGVIAYELLSGTPAFAARGREDLVKRICESSPKPLHALRREVPERLEQAIARCLEKSPAARWQTVVELGRALAPFATPLTHDLAARFATATTPAEASASAATLRPPTEHNLRATGIDQPVFDAKPGDAVAFRKMTSDGRIEALGAEEVVQVVRAKRIISDAQALAKAGPKTSVPTEEEAEPEEIKALGGPEPASSKVAQHAGSPSASADGARPMAGAANDPRRKTLAVLILIIAVCSGLLIGLVAKILMR